MLTRILGCSGNMLPQADLRFNPVAYMQPLITSKVMEYAGKLFFRPDERTSFPPPTTDVAASVEDPTTRVLLPEAQFTRSRNGTPPTDTTPSQRRLATAKGSTPTTPGPQSQATQSQQSLDARIAYERSNASLRVSNTTSSQNFDTFLRQTILSNRVSRRSHYDWSKQNFSKPANVLDVVLPNPVGALVDSASNVDIRMAVQENVLRTSTGLRDALFGVLRPQNTTSAGYDVSSV
jgi:hypothetical protein